jgi:hypothetical protein
MSLIGEVIVPGICMNPGCDYTANVEADQPEGYCELEGTLTVQSCLIIAGLV